MGLFHLFKKVLPLFYTTTFDDILIGSKKSLQHVATNISGHAAFLFLMVLTY